MNRNEIITSLLKYKKEEFRSKYLDDTINYFKQMRNDVKIITGNEMMLTGIRLNLLYNKSKYNVYITSILIKEDIVCYREIKLDQQQNNNLVKQMDAINKNTNNICNNISNNVVKKKYYYFIVTDKNVNLPCKDKKITKNYYNIISLYLGIQSFLFLKHQNIDNYCKLLKKKESIKLVNIFNNLKKIVSKLSWQEQDRFLIYSRATFHFLGTLYSDDIDLIYVSNDDISYKKYKFKKDQNIHIILKNKVIEYNQEKLGIPTLKYKNNYYKYELSQYVNAEDIYTVLINPKHYFHFLGIKFLDFFISVKKGISQSSPLTIIDTVLLNKFNNINFLKDYCIKNIIIKKGLAMIINNDGMNDLYDNVIKYMKEWYNIKITKSFLKDHFIKCEKRYKTIYYNKPKIVEKSQRIIFKFNRYVVSKYLKLFCKNIDSVLDIGIGKGSAIKDYIDIGIKNIYGIEPSIYSIESSKYFIKKYKYKKININIKQGYGDVKWDKYLLTKKFKLVILTFTIHYMINNLNILIDNINKVTNSGSYLFIFLIDGNKIFNKIKQNKQNKYEIINNKEPYWGVYEYNEKINKHFVKPIKLLFYMKGVYGVNNGSEEYLVNINDLIKKFKNFKLIKKNSFLNELKNSSYNKKIFLDYQKKILDIHMLLIFKKN